MLNIVALVGVMFLIPESPKYLITQKRFDEARTVINYIAKLNGKYRRKTFTSLFDREVFESRYLPPTLNLSTLSSGSIIYQSPE